MMCPIMKNNFDIYQSSVASGPGASSSTSRPGSQPRSRKTSQGSNRSSAKWSHAMSPNGYATSGPTSLSSSPGSDIDERLRAVVGAPADGPQANRMRRISRSSEHGTAATSANVMPLSVSTSSLSKFHMRLVDKLDKLRRALRGKDDSALKTTT